MLLLDDSTAIELSEKLKGIPKNVLMNLNFIPSSFVSNKDLLNIFYNNFFCHQLSSPL